MPTYVYKREDGTTFEIRQGMNDPALTECPDTGLPVKRVISGGLDTHLVGSKWAGKQAKKEKQIKENPHLTTLPHYDKKIKDNTEKAREIKGKHKSANLTEI